MQFSHLHCHTQYSLLDGAAKIEGYMQKAVDDGQPAVAITDHGNMFGVFNFWNAATKKGIKPIIGCEFYVVHDRFQKKFEKGTRDKRFHQLLLAKNAKGYQNISKLCSLGFIDGLYGKFPRIDRALIKQYSEGIIATSCCVAAEVPRTFLEKGPEAAEQILLEWIDIFGEDYYIEIQRHNLTGIDQEGCNQFLIEMARKHNIKMIATNDSHYVDQDDWDAHDVLLCINTGDFKDKPVAVTDAQYRDKNYRFGFENDQFYFKTKAEMYERFKDIPEALENTIEIVDKVDTPSLKRDILLPNFTLPESFKTQDEYLKYLCFEGAKQRYGELTSEVVERIEHELKIIENMGFAGYFLIVQDFIAAARDLGVAVGPGRGSAAGSAVAFATGITNIDPIKYKLLFERFLNPERISMPDIDIDFDDENRQRVIDWVVDKYGKNQVAQIITYGTMAAKSSIKDVGRVLQYPLSDTNALAKMVPDGAGMTLKKAFKENPELEAIKHSNNGMQSKVVKLAEELEGSIRQRGIHAAGVIIAPDDITNYIPVCTAKDSDMLVTQFDGRVVEDAGMLKMDFLGLKTLSIINDAIKNIEKSKGIVIDPDTIPLDDEKTFELYQDGSTIGTFQFESEGMRKHLKHLKPTNIEDLIAMNALYRPGPMDYIPSFIDRKHGREKVEYPHEWLEQILSDTYGIMVYQEQIMQTAQIIAGYSLGKADLLRRAMGKKKVEEMAKQRVIFREGAVEKGIDAKQADEIFDIMEKFAAYGFNRSHSAAYSVVAYQTAYLKANHPAEYMAAVLTHSMSDIKRVEFFLRESSRIGVTVLGPCVNESEAKFTVNDEGAIRFGLNAVKGVGEAAVEGLIEERSKAGKFTGLVDLCRRANLRAVNKKCLESLAYAGAFDTASPEIHRRQYFYPEGEQDMNYLATIVKFGQKVQQQSESLTNSLFGDVGGVEIPEPQPDQCEEWALLDRLRHEKNVIGLYLSGHPLDNYKYDIKSFINASVDDIEDKPNVQLRIAGIVTEAAHKLTKNGKPFGILTLEDYVADKTFFVFGEDYVKNKHYFEVGLPLCLEGKYQPRKWNKDEFEFKIEQFSLLGEIRERFAQQLEITLMTNDLSTELIEHFESVCSDYPGKYGVKFQILDPKTNYKVFLKSSKFKVDIHNDALFETIENKLLCSYSIA